MVHNWIHQQHKALSEGLSEPLFLPDVNDLVYPNKTTTIRFLRFESCYGLRTYIKGTLMQIWKIHYIFGFI